MPAGAAKKPRRSAASAVNVRLRGDVALEPQANGELVASFADGYSLGLGRFRTTPDRLKSLRTGVPLASAAAKDRDRGAAIDPLIRHLAQVGLLEFRLGHARAGADLAVIEPQLPDFWPQAAPLTETDTLVLSRFAYLRRRANEMVLESPRAGAVVRICDPGIAALLARLSTPQQVRDLRRHDGFPGSPFLGLLLESRILLKLDHAAADGQRRSEGDDDLVLWDFHDLLFHARSTEGRHTNPLGGTYLHTGSVPPLPAVRPRWPGEPIDLRKLSGAPLSPVAKILRQRRSTRSFDTGRPITLAELARFLDGCARVVAHSGPEPGAEEGGHAPRPYPSAGAAYELELYLAVDKCDGLTRGFYHYDADAHALTAIPVAADTFDAQLAAGGRAMGAAPPQVLITIAARFGRISWKYSSIAYSLVLRDAGVLMQTLYLMASDMGLGGCAIGLSNIERFAKMTGLEFHVESPVGQFALGRPTAARG